MARTLPPEKIGRGEAMVVPVPVFETPKTIPGCPTICCRRGFPVHSNCRCDSRANFTSHTTKRPYRC